MTCFFAHFCSVFRYFIHIVYLSIILIIMESKEIILLKKNTFLENAPEIDPDTINLYEKRFSFFDPLPDGLLHPIAGNEQIVHKPCEVRFLPMPFLFFLYCMEGMLVIDNGLHRYTIPGGHFISLPLYTALHITVNMVPCSLRYYFVGGDFRTYEPMLAGAAPIHPALHSPSPLTLEGLSHLPEQISTSLIWKTHLLLTHILTAYADLLTRPTAESSPASTGIPGYLDAMHHAIHTHSEEPHTLQHFEDRYGVNRFRLCREYHAVYGISPMQELIHIRIEKARRLLLETPFTIQEIATQAGFYDLNNFMRIFKKKTGLTPGQYRKNGAVG